MRAQLPLIGRHHDLDLITQRLADPTCRLLTLLGSGGSGKTHLALTVAEQIRSQFADGVTVIPLQAIDAPERLATVICEALAIPLSGKANPDHHLPQALSTMDVLLILDNYEHLLPDVELLSAIMHTAPDVTLFVTSREPLHLRGEWLYPLAGLPFPQTIEEAQQQTYDAVDLFASCATRVKPQFDLENNLPAVVRICKAVQGLPLGIELAAAWVQSLTCGEIADEVERNLDFLQTQLHDVPERHRSLRAVFNQTWAGLVEEEQTCFRRLAVFRGGFEREAAEAVTDSGWMTLAALSNKMMLQRDEDGRYLLHELLRQFALEKLREADEYEATRQAHARYYAQFLADRREGILGESQHTVTAEIICEFENILSNFTNMLCVPDPAIVDQIIYPINDALQFRNRYQDARRLFEQAVDVLNGGRSTVTYEATTMLGWTHIRLGSIDLAETFAVRALALTENHGITPLPGFASDAHTLMSVIGMIRGDYQNALSWAQAALDQATRLDDLPNQAMAYYNLCDAHMARSEYDQAHFYIQQAVLLCRRLGDEWFMAYCLNHLGHIMRIRGDYIAAHQHYQESYRIREPYDDVEGMAIALTNLGYIALLQEHVEEAHTLLKRGHDLYRTIDDKGGMVIVLYLLGESSIALQEIAAACDYLSDALMLAREMDSMPRILAIVSRVGLLALTIGWLEVSTCILHFTVQHPHAEPETIEHARLHLKRIEGQVKPEAHQQAVERGTALTLDDAIHENQSVIAHARMQPPGKLQKAGAQRTQNQNLIEPLSEREMEVLTLLVDGMTNREIADHLIVAEGTIKTHNHNIFSKLGVRNRLRAVMRARELGLVD